MTRDSKALFTKKRKNLLPISRNKKDEEKNEQFIICGARNNFFYSAFGMIRQILFYKVPGIRKCKRTSYDPGK